MKRPFPENRDAVSAGFIRLLFNRGTRVLHAFLATFLSLKESSPCNEATLSLLPSSCISNTGNPYSDFNESFFVDGASCNKRL